MNTYDKDSIQKKGTDNPHDKGYKRIFSIKKNFLDFIKKYIGLGVDDGTRRKRFGTD